MIRNDNFLARKVGPVTKPLALISYLFPLSSVPHRASGGFEGSGLLSCWSQLSLGRNTRVAKLFSSMSLMRGLRVESGPWRCQRLLPWLPSPKLVPSWQYLENDHRNETCLRGGDCALCPLVRGIQGERRSSYLGEQEFAAVLSWPGGTRKTGNRILVLYFEKGKSSLSSGCLLWGSSEETCAAVFVSSSNAK